MASADRRPARWNPTLLPRRARARAPPGGSRRRAAATGHRRASRRRPPISAHDATRFECASSSRRCRKRYRGRGSPLSRSDAERSSSGSPPAFVTSTVPFQARIAIRPIVVARADGLDHVARAVAGDRRCHAMLEELLDHPEAPPAWLAQVPDRQQPEAAVQEPRRPAELLEVVGDRPVGERLGAAHCRRHAAHEVRGAPR